MEISLTQFEEIDSLFKACLARPTIEAVMTHSLASADYMRTVYFRPEWKLLDACVEATSLSYVDEFGSTIDCAAHILTAAMIGCIGIADMEAA